MESSNQSTASSTPLLCLPPPREVDISEQFRTLIKVPSFRREMGASFVGWQILHLSHYHTLAPADFHAELDALLEDDDEKFLSVIGFRGSAKSSKGSLALPLFLALEKPERYPFIIIVAETRDQVIENIANMRHELEENVSLKEDYGDMSDGVSKQREWTKTGLLLKNGVKIVGISRGQRIRGRRHKQHRPSIVIVDDPEEMQKVDKKEYRDKTEKWLRGEVIPAIEETRARLIVLGNILHTDAIMARLKNDPIFTHRDYSLFSKPDSDRFEDCTWKAKYTSQEAIDKQKQKVRHTSWMREYRLKVVPPDGQEIKEEWIQYYDDVPSPYVQRDVKTGRITLELNPIQKTGVGEDLAISKNQTADYTTMVGGALAEGVLVEGDQAKLDGNPSIYILPNPVNERLSLHETLGRMRNVRDAMGATVGVPIFYIEDVAYQRAAIEEAQRNGFAAVPIRVGTDKRSRLRAAAIFVQNGTVKFPRKGAEDLIAQLVGFGIEEHDDLADAFVNLVLGLRMGGFDRPEVITIFGD